MQVKLDGITSCVIEEDDNAVRIFGGSVIGKHTREIMPIREWFKMVVLYTPRLFSYKVRIFQGVQGVYIQCNIKRCVPKELLNEGSRDRDLDRKQKLLYVIASMF